jgi:hypothetical protein
MFKQILTIPLALISPVVLACSFAQPTPVEFDKSKAKKGESAPAVPKVTLVSVSRGYADNTGDSCADTGVIVLSVPANAANKSLVYTFEMISGKDVAGIFYTQPIVGVEYKNSYLFVFPWIDGASGKQEPLNFVVRVTAYRKSGLKGDSVDVKIKDPGR